MTETELERIRNAYRARDASLDSPYRWDNPGYVFYMQGVEQAVLHALTDAGVRLAGARVLDVGCGTGYFLHRLREYGAGKCHGIDLMDDRIAAGKERYPTLDLRVGSATDLPYADGGFDVVTQFTCLSSILDDEVRLAVASEMRRVAKGGWVLSFDMRGLRLRTPAMRHREPPESTPTVPLDSSELRRLFGEPALLRREALAFELAQRTGRHPLLSTALGLVPLLRSHLLGLWHVPQRERYISSQTRPTASKE
jgi:SAM-dependent methyltransferase